MYIYIYILVLSLVRMSCAVELLARGDGGLRARGQQLE